MKTILMALMILPVIMMNAGVSGFSAGTESGFIENKGQVLGYDNLPHSEVKFIFQQAGMQIFLLNTGIAYQFTQVHYPDGLMEAFTKKDADSRAKIKALDGKISTEVYRMDMVLTNADPHAVIIAEGRSEDYTNYYNRGVVDVHHYSKITYHNVYPGIDWVVYLSGGTVKYDFVVRPGADPSLIRLDFKHQQDLGLNPDGSFTLKNQMGSVTEKKPLSFQDGKEIKTAFTLSGNSLTFRLEHYNTDEVLTIDPALTWATYYGSYAMDLGSVSATDAAGNIYLSGSAASAYNISAGGYQNMIGGIVDAFLVKFDAGGNRLWGTYFGGPNWDWGYSCATDASGNVYLAGTTPSTVNIATSGYQNTYGGGGDEAFLVKFNTGGQLQWATYYGGTGDEDGNSCATDPSGNVYLAGTTTSSADIASGGYQNTAGGIQDAFLVKFNTSGARLWSTYYGDSQYESGAACCTDASGNVFLSGATSSPSNIASSGAHQNLFGAYYDAYLVKFNSSGIRQWGTYYGGWSLDWGYGCATDAAGDIYLTGYTASTNNIASGGYQNSYAGTTNGVFDDAFLVKFNAAGVRQWGTYFGGPGDDVSYASAVDPSGNVYICGGTSSSVGIAVAAYQSNYGGGTSGNGLSPEGFIAGFAASGALIWSSYYGDTGQDYCTGCTSDASGNIYLTGCTRFSTNNIASANGYQNTSGGDFDAFLCKFCVGPTFTSAISGHTMVCISSSQAYSIPPATGAATYSWAAPAGWAFNSSLTGIQALAGSSGTIGVAATNSCGTGAAQTISVISNPLPVIGSANGTICAGQSFTAYTAGANTYTYSGGNIVSPSVTTTYSVTGTSVAGCTSTAVFSVTVNHAPQITAGSGTVCIGHSYTLTPHGAATYTFSGGSAIVSPTANTSYSVTGTSSAGCTATAPVIYSLTVVNEPLLSVVASNTLLCYGESISLIVSGAEFYSFDNVTGTNSVLVGVPLSTGIYTLSGGNAGCSKSIFISLTVAACTGINAFSSPDASLKAYPNPNQGHFTVTQSGNESTALSLYNLLGEKLMEIALDMSTHEQDVSILQLPAGIYLLHAQKGNQTVSTLRIIKE